MFVEFIGSTAAIVFLTALFFALFLIFQGFNKLLDRALPKALSVAGVAFLIMAILFFYDPFFSWVKDNQLSLAALALIAFLVPRRQQRH